MNQRLYYGLLSNFANKYADVDQTILELIEIKKDEEIFRSVHTLKGLSGSIGASVLSTNLKHIEEALRQSCGTQLMSALKQLLPGKLTKRKPL